MMATAREAEWTDPVIATCQCHHIFRTRTKLVQHEGRLRTITEKPCPNCERTDGLIGVHSDWGDLRE